jgi:hypothetical protein
MKRPLAQTFLTLRPITFEYQLGLLAAFDTQVIENIGRCYFDMPSHAVGLQLLSSRLNETAALCAAAHLPMLAFIAIAANIWPK